MKGGMEITSVVGKGSISVGNEMTGVDVLTIPPPLDDDPTNVAGEDSEVCWPPPPVVVVEIAPELETEGLGRAVV